MGQLEQTIATLLRANAHIAVYQGDGDQPGSVVLVHSDADKPAPVVYSVALGNIDELAGLIAQAARDELGADRAGTDQ